jgi:large subunit ribosomal protein L3
MAGSILGRKLGMTQVWGDGDRLIPVTVIEAGPCVVSQVKTKKRDGYEAVQLAYGDIKPSKVNKPMAGHFAKAGVTPRRYIAEARLGEGEIEERSIGALEFGLSQYCTILMPVPLTSWVPL